MSDLVGNPEDRFSHNEAHFGLLSRILVLIVPVPGHCFSLHYVNISILIKFSQKTSVFTLIIISSP